MVLCRLDVQEGRGRPPKSVMNMTLPDEYDCGYRYLRIQGKKRRCRLYRMVNMPTETEMRFLCRRFSNLRFVVIDGEMMMAVVM